jgi:hypothetical protein
MDVFYLYFFLLGAQLKPNDVVCARTRFIRGTFLFQVNL